MVNIRQMLVDSSKYYIKCPYPMNPIGITIHNTANDASANNEVSYMRNNNNETSFHYAVDDVEIVQGLPLDRNGWHASDGGDGIGNRRTIAIEICYSKSGGSRFDKAEKNAVDLVVYLLKKYGWGIDKVKRHYDYARDKKYCPHRTMDKGWNRFLNMIQAELNPKPQPSETMYRVICGSYTDRENAVEMQNKLKAKGYTSFLDAFIKDGKNYLRVICGSFSDKDNANDRVAELQNKGFSCFIAIYGEKPKEEDKPEPPKPVEKRYAKNGTFYFTVGVSVRSQPTENSRTGAEYYVGEHVVFTHIIENKNGFNWVEYTRANGQKGYIKTKDLSNGESYGYFK